eukprot:1202508-Rhodomonas_salina.1
MARVLATVGAKLGAQAVLGLLLRLKYSTSTSQVSVDQPAPTAMQVLRSHAVPTSVLHYWARRSRREVRAQERRDSSTGRQQGLEQDERDAAESMFPESSQAPFLSNYQPSFNDSFESLPACFRRRRRVRLTVSHTL